MKYVKPQGQNADFGKPPDWDDRNGTCGSLPVRKEVEGEGSHAYLAIYSNWKPSVAELAALNAGGVVELCCCGSQPAVSVSVVPCADPDVIPEPVTEQFLRNLFAEQLTRFGNHACDVLAQAVRSGTDNSHGGEAAVAALKRVVGLA